MRQFASISVAILAGSLLSSAAPIRRQAPPSNNDVLVLQFADVLEQLESQFYAQALSQYQESDFTNAGFSSAQLAIQQIQAIQSDESTHASVLESSLPDVGGQPISGCTFDFSSALTDVSTTLAVARIVENVGVGAYLGAATLISDPIILEAAGSILTVEARHQTMLNLLGGTGSAIPAAFDIPLKPQEVLAIAGPFISGCSTGITANPTLSITNTGDITPGTTLTFQSSALNSSTDGLFCQMLTGGAPFSTPLPLSQCTVPSDIAGPVAVFITSDGQPLAGNVRDRASTQLVAGPTITFVDGSSQLMGEMIRSVSGAATASGATVTSTITPDEANSIIASAQAQPTGAVSSPSSSSSSSSGCGSSCGSAGAAPAAASGSASAPAAASSGSASANSSGSGTPAPAVVNSPATDDVAGPNGPNLYQGPSPDGKETVNGVSSVPANEVSTAPAPSASA